MDFRKIEMVTIGCTFRCLTIIELCSSCLNTKNNEKSVLQPGNAASFSLYIVSIPILRKLFSIFTWENRLKGTKWKRNYKSNILLL